MNEVLFFLNFSHYWHLQINDKIFPPFSLDALLVAGDELAFGGRGE